MHAGASQHECKGLLHVLPERLEPSSSDSSIHSPVIRRERCPHHLNSLETLGFIGRELELCGRPGNGQDARLRRVYDRVEVVHAEHSEVRDGERPSLILLGLQLAFSCSASEGFGLGGYGSKAFGADVFDDGGDETVGGGDGDADVCSFVSMTRIS